MPKTIDRHMGPLSGRLFAELAAAQQPAIFDGLFDGQPIRRISTIADLPPPWANTPVRPRKPAENINHPGDAFPDTTIQRFLAEKQPGFVFAKIPLAASGAPVVPPRPMVELGTPTTHFMYYMGNPGAFTHLHFDANCQHNMHYQMIGRKRFFLFPEHRSKYLAPYRQSSRIFLERMSEAERLHFADYAGGFVGTLEPGQSLFIPALMWHYVEYAEPAISISFRFGRSRLIEALFRTIGGLHPTAEFQHLAMGLLDDSNISPAYLDIHAQLLHAVGDKYEFTHVQRLLEELCGQHCPEKIECLYANWQDASPAVG